MGASAVICLCVLLVGVRATTLPVFHNLHSSDWSVQNSNASIKVGATVPGGIYSDLRKAGVLTQDIFYRFNDVDYRWVARDNWTYSTVFNVDPEMLQKQDLFLEFSGLDTVARVELNSQLLGDTDNMFTLYRFPVKHLLQESENQLSVQFTSAILAAQQAAAQSPYAVPPACVPAQYHGECHANYMRKMQASFAWDWGPAFPSVGIWRSVGLRGYDHVYARHVGVETHPDGHHWRVSVTLHLNVEGSVDGSLSAMLVLNGTHKVSSQRQVNISPRHSSPSLVFSVPKNSVKLWWPNGLGHQTLYRLTVSFTSGQQTTHQTVNIGFRTVQLVQVPTKPSNTSQGLTFYFRVNGEAVFAKGSNYIPAHILPELGAEPTRLRHLLTSARDANMNMLRVWGGGVYESDLFYQMCDELGILIWQDMMFACSMYPTTERFLASVREEVTQQVERLQHHACVAVWAGNNENEAALAGNWYGTQANFSLFKQDYVKLYVDTIGAVVKRLDKSRSYVTSSPSNGLESEKEGYIAKNPYDNRYGDVHWYQYGLNLWNPTVFPKTRFASEYGIMSLPSLESFANITIPEDLVLTSAFLSSRQHHPLGYTEIMLEIKFNMNLPPDADLDNFIYLSQINQAMSIKTETESYRRGRNQLDSIGQGLTMGALYWQLNDVWQAPSWSSLEFSGKWKMLHYFAVDFFAPVLVSPSVDVSHTLSAEVISDLRLHSSLELLLQLSVYNWNSLSPLLIQHYRFKIVGGGVVHVQSWKIADVLRSIEGCNYGGLPEKNCFFHFSLLSSNTSTSVGPDNFFFPAPLNSINGLTKANIQVVEIKAVRGGLELILTLKTDAIALFVWLDAVGVPGHFSHNGFLLVQQQTQVTFTAAQPVSLQVFRQTLTIRSYS